MSEYIVKCNEVVGISGKALIVPDYIDTSKEIVRCRDCTHYEKLSDDKCVCHPLGIVFADMDDGYCAWSKRKEGGERNSEPFVEYAARVAKELHDEAFALLEGCDEPEFSSIDAICGLCADIVKVAKRWRIRKVIGDD